MPPARFAGEIGAESAGLEGGDPRGVAGEDDIRRGAALEHLADENQFAVFVAVADAIANHSFLHGSREFGSEVAHLVGVRQENEFGLGGFDYLAQGERETVRRVLFEQIVFGEQHFVELEAGEIIGEWRDAFADYDGGECAAGLLDDLLGGGERLEADGIPFAFALFGDEDFHWMNLRCARGRGRLVGFELFDELGGDFLRLAGDEFGFLGFLRDVDALDVLRRCIRNP